MSTEPALMSLTSVASGSRTSASLARGTQSCLERIARWQPIYNAFMALEAEPRWPPRCRRRALAKGGRRGRSRRAVGHQGMYYEAGKVVTCGSRIVAISSPRPLDALQRLKRRRHDPTGLVADGRVRLWADRHNRRTMVRCITLRARSHHGGSSSGSGRVAARLHFAALGSDTAARSGCRRFLRVTGLKTTVGRSARPVRCIVESLDTVARWRALPRIARSCSV